MKLRLALVGIMLGSGAPVGAWADEQQPNCNLSSSLVGHIQAQLQAVVIFQMQMGESSSLIACGLP
jgi:hypothetical protein